MIRQKRKYDKDDKIKAKFHYENHKEETKIRNKKYYEENKKSRFKGLYSVNPNTKKAKRLKDKIDKVNKEIKELNLKLGIKISSSVDLKNSLVNVEERTKPKNSQAEYYLKLIEEKEQDDKNKESIL